MLSTASFPVRSEGRRRSVEQPTTDFTSQTSGARMLNTVEALAPRIKESISNIVLAPAGENRTHSLTESQAIDTITNRMIEKVRKYSDTDPELPMLNVNIEFTDGQYYTLQMANEKVCLIDTFRIAYKRFESIQENVHRAGDLVKTIVSECGFYANDVAMIAEELVENARKHGNSGDPSETINLLVFVSRSCATLIVEQTGKEINDLDWAKIKTPVRRDIEDIVDDASIEQYSVSGIHVGMFAVIELIRMGHEQAELKDDGTSLAFDLDFTRLEGNMAVRLTVPLRHPTEDEADFERRLIEKRKD